MACLSTRTATAGTVYDEVGDAGESLATAQAVVGPAGALDAIRGNLTGGADLFAITLTAGQGFVATTSQSGIAYNDFDTELFLFDSAGRGIQANDDSPSSPPQSALTGFTPTASGTYYLAIAGAGYLPTSSGGQIFASSGGLLTSAGTPTGTGGASPLSGWSSVSSETGAYEIRLFGASIPAVPEPQGWMLLGAGLAALGWTVRRRRPALVALALAAATASGGVQAQYARMDSALSDLIDSQQPGKAPATRAGRAAAAATTAAGLSSAVLGSAVYDRSSRILVDIYLDGSVDIDTFVARLQSLGAEISGVNPDFAKGAVSAYVPVPALGSISIGGGLNVMNMTVRPQGNAGVTTSQGVKVVRSDVANASGFTGVGITVGVLSDSYDKALASFTAVHAADDIASGDLATPKLVIDSPASATDEGRAMMQIVHDVAPDAGLCFATASNGEAAFAANIRSLRTNPNCNADVIVDDYFYFDEPYFSDGQLAQVVNQVATSTTLAGKQVAYFSSAQNQGGAAGYGAIDVPVAIFSATPTNIGNINLASAATCTSTPATGSTKADVSGGWLDFGGGTYAVPLTLSVGANANGRLDVQWDDLFYQGKVTTDLNVFVFNASGACVYAFAGNNLSTDNAQEFVNLTFGAAGGTLNGRIMIARTGAGTQQATRLRLINLGGWSGAALQVISNPSTFGHNAANGASSVAAYRYSVPYTASPYVPAIEAFTNPGPVSILFDADGHRMAVPETRKKPDIAAPDGGNTTFFYPGTDPDADGYPNFFGTSAAAPHAAGVAALLLQKAGGPGMLAPKQVKTLLQTTAPPRAMPHSGSTNVAKGWNIYDGFGLIDAVAALARLP